MKASDYLVAPRTAVHAGEAIPVGTNGPNKVSVLGSSVPVSVKRCTPVTTFAIYPDREGVVAVWIDSTPRRAFFVGVVSAGSDENGLLYRLDLNLMWVSAVGRIGQAYDHGVLSVLIDEKEYHTGKTYSSDGPYISDGDLLCKYLAGDVDAEAVKAAAVEHEEEISARETLKRIMESCKAICNDPSDPQVTIAELISDRARLQRMADIYYPLIKYLGDRGLFAPFGAVKPEYFEEDLDRRIGSVVALLLDIRGAYNEGSFFFRRQVRKAYEAYMNRAKEMAHFAPNKL